MKKKVRLADMPDLDFAEHLDTDQAVAQYLTVILEENDPALLAAALGDIARARVCVKLQKRPALAAKRFIKLCDPMPNPVSTPSTGSALHWASSS